MMRRAGAGEEEEGDVDQTFRPPVNVAHSARFLFWKAAAESQLVAVVAGPWLGQFNFLPTLGLSVPFLNV